MPHQRVRKGSTSVIHWTIDGYPDTGSADPALSITLPDGTAAAYTLTPPVAPVSVDSISDDRQTLTLTASLDGEMFGRLRGGVYIKADAAVFSAIVSDVSTSTLVLSAPLAAGVSPESVAWAVYSATIGPTYGGGDGPTAAVSTLDATIAYTLLAPGDGATEARTGRYSVEVEQRTFDTGLTEPDLLQRLAPFRSEFGGVAAGHRAGDYQNVIDATEDEIRDHVEEALTDLGYRIDRILATRDFFEPHVLLVRSELAEDLEMQERLRDRALATIKRKVKSLPRDSDDDGVEDGDISVGVALPTNMSLGFTVSTTRFNRDDVL